MSEPQSLIDRVWAAHEITRREDGAVLLWVDRHYVHEGSFHAFSQMKARGRTVAAPELTFGVADHYVPTRGRAEGIADPELATMVRNLESNAAESRITLFGLRDPRQGIVHVVGPEQGLTLPGLLIVCGDSHTSTHGAFGAYAFGIGASQVAHVLLTQTLWQKKPKRMRVSVEGRATPGVGAKDIALAIIAHVGADGAQGHAIEFSGSAIRELTIEGRMTLCNMSIEAGGRCSLVAPDASTFAYLKGRPYAPRGADFDVAVEAWSMLASDVDAEFDRDVTLDAAMIAPVVTWGTTPDDGLPIDAHVPDPKHEPDEARKKYIEEALAYMGIAPGTRLTDIAIDRIFIGSCTNARIEDLRSAATVLAGRVSKVPGLVSPGSSLVKRQA
jgi:3-isopropylmalate/(R)-2-methylmalate dehydratase large subunit